MTTKELYAKLKPLRDVDFEIFFDNLADGLIPIDTFTVVPQSELIKKYKRYSKVTAVVLSD